MVKDYKNVSASAKKKRRSGNKPNASPVKDRRKTNDRRNRSQKSTQPTPGWVWMLGGLAIGLGFAAIVYFYDGSNSRTTAVAAHSAGSGSAPAKPEPKAAETKPPPTKKEATPQKEEESPRFDFYTLLPELEVVIPESEIREQQEKIKPKEDVAYMIQVGSFRKYGDADALKANLAMLGIEADIEPVSANGEQWLRVRVGPFIDKRQLNKVRNRLHSNNYNTMLVRLRKKDG